MPLPGVQGFELERYRGTWYEIARLDHPFERELERVTAEYSRREEGGVVVSNPKCLIPPKTIAFDSPEYSPQPP